MTRIRHVRWIHAAVLVCCAVTAPVRVATQTTPIVIVQLPTVTLSVGTATTVAVAYHSQGPAVVALQCDWLHDGSLSTLSATSGTAAVAADKSVQSARTLDGSLRVFVMGFNQDVMPDGDVLLMRIKANSNATVARHSLNCPNAVAVTAQGKKVGIDVVQGNVYVVP